MDVWLRSEENEAGNEGWGYQEVLSMGHFPVKGYGLLADQSLEGRDVEDLI